MMKKNKKKVKDVRLPELNIIPKSFILNFIINEVTILKEVSRIKIIFIITIIITVVTTFESAPGKCPPFWKITYL